RLTLLAARDQRGVDRNERRRQRAFTEQVLEKVGNAERGVERVGRVGLEAEVVREDAKTDEARETTAQNAESDEERRTCSISRRGPAPAAVTARRVASTVADRISQRRRRSRPSRACRSTSASDTP